MRFTPLLVSLLLLRAEFLPEKYQSLTVIKLIPDLQWSTWAIGLLALLLILAVAGSREVHKKLSEDRESLRNPYSGSKWENFVGKIGTLPPEQKYILQEFVLKGCHMTHGEAQSLLKERYSRDDYDVLKTISGRTGFISSGINGYEANPGIAHMLEHWARFPLQDGARRTDGRIAG